MTDPHDDLPMIRPRQVRRRSAPAPKPAPRPAARRGDWRDRADDLTKRIVMANPLTGEPDLRRPFDPDAWEPGLFDIVADPALPPGVMVAVAIPAQPRPPAPARSRQRQKAKAPPKPRESTRERRERRTKAARKAATPDPVMDVRAEDLRPGDLIAGTPSGLAVSKVTVRGGLVEVLFGERVAGGLALTVGQMILIRRDKP